jgi:hypothetical protein
VNAQEKDAKVAPLTQKEEVGRATWMLLHTIAAQVLHLCWLRELHTDVQRLYNILANGAFVNVAGPWMPMHFPTLIAKLVDKATSFSKHRCSKSIFCQLIVFCLLLFSVS